MVAIKKNTIDSKLHILTNKTCTFLFYNFNFNRCGDPIQKVRHKIISENKHGIVKLQKQDWLYFKENLLKVSEKKIDLENNGTKIDSVENKLLLDTISNLETCRHFNNTMYNTVADNLQEMILANPMQY